MNVRLVDLPLPVLVALRDGDIIVGNAGCKGAPNAAGEVELGYTVLTAHRRQGLAIAAARLLVERCIREPSVTSLFATIAPDNVGSASLPPAPGGGDDGGETSDDSVQAAPLPLAPLQIEPTPDPEQTPEPAPAPTETPDDETTEALPSTQSPTDDDVLRILILAVIAFTGHGDERRTWHRSAPPSLRVARCHRPAAQIAPRRR